MSKCRICGLEIIFAKDENGKWQVLDAVAPVYITSILGQDEWGNLTYKATRAGNSIMVSHFATCPKSNEFSKQKKKAIA